MYSTQFSLRYGYLTPDAKLVAKWSEAMGNRNNLRIGIVWQGNPFHSWDSLRSIPLVSILDAVRMDGLEIYSLQRVHGLEQIGCISNPDDLILLNADLESSGVYLPIPLLLLQIWISLFLSTLPSRPQRCTRMSHLDPARHNTRLAMATESQGLLLDADPSACSGKLDKVIGDA